MSKTNSMAEMVKTVEAKIDEINTALETADVQRDEILRKTRIDLEVQYAKIDGQITQKIEGMKEQKALLEELLNSEEKE